ncbi:hypothetical protein SP15_217 [Bacillus phage SP-15]|uniref:Uncharacterized protein n=1 Tax=Bacillus phage SP-15 TaxID=1792032 RepID=A0A127AWQ3_9CAUD|nr:hypothetical protein SP15_217 [Bacillus phage SP-15]AMM45017.1 hypothetical protein SP15_217 [Bacillus phage SP-15]
MENLKEVFGEKVTQIVKGVSRKYGREFGIETSDLEQELWLKLLEISDGEKVPNEKIVARTSYNKAVDVYRYERRRWDSKTDMVSDETVSAWAREIGNSRNPLMAERPFRQPEKFFEIKEMVEQFEIGSKERKFVVMKGYIEGVFELNEAVELEPTIDAERLVHMEDSEHRMARELGWSSSGSGSYRSMKKKARKIVRSYFGE